MRIADDSVVAELFEVAPLGIALVDESMRFVLVNDALCEMLGYTRSEFLKLHVTDISHPESQNEDVRAKFLAGDIAHVTLEKRQVTKQGDSKWVRVNACIFRPGSKEAEFGALFVEDISDRVLRERELASRSADAMESLSRLTVREKQVLHLAAQEKTFNEIAEILYLSKRTVESHAAAAYRKLGVSGRDDALSAYAELQRLIDLRTTLSAETVSPSSIENE